MSINSVEAPYPIFTDIDGNPLEDGYIYIGEASQNPEAVPVSAYWDSALTVPAAQPIRTIGGYPSRSGTAARVYVTGDYSITIKNKNSTLIYTAPAATGILSSINSFASIDGLIGYTTASENTSVNVSGYYSANDKGGGLFNYDSTVDKSTANAGTIVDPSVSLALQGTGVGLGCWARQTNGNIDSYMFGAKGDGATDDTLAAQAMVDYSVAEILSGDKISIDFTGIIRITDTLTIPVSNTGVYGRVPDIYCSGEIHYDGVNDRSAIIIGDNTDVVFAPKIELSIINDNQSDWTNDNCVGVELININSAININIREARQFTDGVKLVADGQGFAYNEMSFGYITDNKRGIHAVTLNSGWVNENLFLSGRMAVTSTVNTTLERYGVVLEQKTGTILNNNLFIKPSFELSNNTAPGLGTGIVFIGCQNNHVVDCRSENTEYIANFDADSGENLVEVGYSDSTSRGVVDLGKAGNVVIEPRNRHLRYTESVFNIENLAGVIARDSSNISYLPGMHACTSTTGAINNWIGGVTAGDIDITLTTTTQTLGVRVDTSSVKSFSLNTGSSGGTSGGRLQIFCYDAAGTLLSGSTPNYAIGTLDSTLSASNAGYLSGSDSAKIKSVRFTDEVKSAFIGVRKGLVDWSFNSFDLRAQGGIDGLPLSSVISPTTTSPRLSKEMRYSASAPTAGTWRSGDIFFDISPSASGNIGWVCTIAGTPGTWKTFGTISA